MATSESSSETAVPNFASMSPSDLLQALTPRLLDDRFQLEPPYAYQQMCREQFVEVGAQYQEAVLRALPKSQKVLYFNFKSHNILNTAKAVEMFRIIDAIDADAMCLSEALVPDAIARRSGELIELHADADSRIVQPYDGEKQNIFGAFKQKKEKDYEGLGGVKTSTWAWEAELFKLGYRFLIFANPAVCPWGANWGNVMALKSRPSQFEVVELGSATGKKGFGGCYDESRCAIGAQIDDGTFLFTTHLENADKRARCAQAAAAAAFIKRFAGGAPRKTLVGDINSLHLASYSESQLKTLADAWWPPLGDAELPHEACDALSAAFQRPPVNAGQQYESMFQKCVSHGWSTEYDCAFMYFTDVTDFDHQPLVLAKGDATATQSSHPDSAPLPPRKKQRT